MRRDPLRGGISGPGVLSFVVVSTKRSAACIAGDRPRPWIVVGVDRSPSAKEALRWADHYRSLAGGTLLVVSACPDAEVSFVEFPEALQAQERRSAEIIQAAETLVDKVIAEVLGTTTDRVVRRVLAGGVADVLLDVSNDADLLVIGSTPRGALGRVLLGSVRHSHLARARCPVVLVRSLER